MKVCPKCNSEHEKNGTYCSRLCANSRGPMSEEAKDSRRTWAKTNRVGFLKNSLTQEEYSLKPKACVTCGQGISWDSVLGRTPLRKTCSDDCEATLRRKSALICNKGTGGKRHGAGRGKKGYYRGIWCDSTYELAFVAFMLAKGHKVERYQGYVEYVDPVDGRTKKYYPDFVVDDIVVEIKGYLTVTDRAKLAACSFPIKLLQGPDLKEAFDYLKEVEGVSRDNLDALYE